MKIFRTFLTIGVMLALFACEKAGDNSNKQYKVSITLETQVYKFDYYNAQGWAVYNWETTGSSSYEVYANTGDNVGVDYPATVSVNDGDSGKVKVVFNEDGNTCNVKNLQVQCSIGGGSQRTSFINNNCGRSRMTVSVANN